MQRTASQRAARAGMAGQQSMIVHTSSELDDRTKDLRAEDSKSLFFGTSAAAFWMLLLYVGAHVVEYLEIAENEDDPKDAIWDQTLTYRRNVYHGGLAFFGIAFFIAAWSTFSRSSWGFMMHSTLNAILTAVAVGQCISFIVEPTPDDTRMRYYVEAAVFFIFGSIASGLSFLAMMRLEVVKMVPAIFAEVDAQTADLLNVLLPSQNLKA